MHVLLCHFGCPLQHSLRVRTVLVLLSSRCAARSPSRKGGLSWVHTAGRLGGVVWAGQGRRRCACVIYFE